MPIFGFFGGNFSWLAKRGSRLVARGSGSQARKIASPHVINTILGHYAHFWIFWREFFVARKKRLAARGSRLGLAGSQNSLPLNLTSKQAGMARFRGVIEFVLFVASILKIRFLCCLIVQSIHQLETIFLMKWIIESLIRSTYQFQL